jgi:hypothetical protein
MLKKIFSAALMAAAILFFATGTTLAASTVKVMNVAVIMEPPVESFDKPEKVYESVEQTVTKIFKNATSFSVLPLDEAAGYVQVYREENELDAETFLKKSDLDKICKRLESDFVVYLRITGTAPKNLSESILGDPAKVILDFRIWSEEQKDFVYTKRVTKTDDYSFEKALNKGLLEVEKDAGKVRAAM